MYEMCEALSLARYGPACGLLRLIVGVCLSCAGWLLLFGGPVAVVLVVIWRRTAPVAVVAVLGALWTTYGLAEAWDTAYGAWRPDPSAAAEDARVAMYWLVPSVAWALVALARRREASALATGERAGEGRWRFHDGAADVFVTRVASGWPVRLSDLRGHVITTHLPLSQDVRVPRTPWDTCLVAPSLVGEPCRLRNPARTGRGFKSSRLTAKGRDEARRMCPPASRSGTFWAREASIGRGRSGAWTFEGPSHLETVWLAGDVPARLAPLVRRGAVVEDGELRLRVTAWVGRRRLRRWIGELTAVVEAVRASGQGAEARVLEQARDRSDSLRRVEAWRTIADHLPVGLQALAPEGLGDPEAVIRAIAARSLGDRAVIQGILERSDDSDAVRRAAEAVREWEWAEMADILASRIGGFAEGAWFSLVQALGDVGGPPHVPRLQELADGRGYPAGLRDEARAAIARIRARGSGVAGGRLSLAAGGGELSLAGAAAR